MRKPNYSYKPGLTWIQNRHMWKKKYRGVPYSITCYKLGMPYTKEGSIQAAYEWWDKLKEQIDNKGTIPQTDEEWDAFIAELDQRIRAIEV